MLRMSVLLACLLLLHAAREGTATVLSVGQMESCVQSDALNCDNKFVMTMSVQNRQVPHRRAPATMFVCCYRGAIQ